MKKKLRDYRYSRIGTLSDIQVEKERLRRKIAKQEKRMERDWKRIEDSWRFVGKIASIGNKLFSSASLLGGIKLGMKLVSHLFSRKRG
jgi:hypothetical protein